MEIVCKEADTYGVALELYALPMGGAGYKPSEEQLVRFYQSFGFKVKGKSDGVPWMLRLPKKVRT